MQESADSRVRAEALFAPLDRARRALLALVARISRPLVAEREPRIAAMGIVLLGVAFALTAGLPLGLLLVGPLVLGVPHVMADIRYLVVRPGLHRRWLLYVVIGAPLLFCFFDGGVRAGMVATAGALVVARGNRWVRALGVVTCAGLFAVASWAGWYADLAFAHLHNFIAVGFFFVWRRRQGKLHYAPLVVFGLGTALLLLGVAEPDISEYPWSIGAGLVPMELSELGGRLVALYAFAQAAHYTMWLRLIPEEDRARPTPRTFASTFRALTSDLGPWLLGMAALAAVGFGVFACVNLVAARDAYLRFAIFHGHLELACGALLLVERRLPLLADAPRAVPSREGALA